MINTIDKLIARLRKIKKREKITQITSIRKERRTDPIDHYRSYTYEKDNKGIL